jgi:uncharacterized protein (DUF983 family)
MFIVVLLSRAAEKTPPLNPVVLLPLIVVFVMLTVPLNWRTPAWLVAELPETVLSVRLRVPLVL